MKKAKIVSAERDGLTSIICPSCNERQSFSTISMDEPYTIKCVKCDTTISVDVKKLIEQINWI